MDLMSINKKNIPDKQIYNQFIDSLSLAPKGFFEKKMNISEQALRSIFVYWKEAIVNFLNGNYIAYDALVGENACQIRAFALMDAALINNSNEYFHSTLITIITELKRIISVLEAASLTNHDTKNSVQDFLRKNNLIFLIPAAHFHYLKYIIDSYLLTLTKEQLPTSTLTLKERTSYKPVRDWGFAYNRAQFLVHNTQKSLSALSCSHVIAQAKLLNNKALSLLLQIKEDAHERSFIPQFFTAKVLFLRALEQNYLLLVKITRYFNLSPIDTAVLCCKPNSYKNDFELYSHSCEDQLCIVIEGVINYKDKDIPESMEEYKSRLFSQSILDTILANFAIHPQYSGELKYLPPPFEEVISALNTHSSKNYHYDSAEYGSHLLNKIIKGVLAEQKEFYRLREFALEKGCSLENLTLLFINHMYCDTTANYTDYLVNTNYLPANTMKYQNSLTNYSQKLS